jgi:hypothetical protein
LKIWGRSEERDRWVGLIWPKCHMWMCEIPGWHLFVQLVYHEEGQPRGEASFKCSSWQIQLSSQLTANIKHQTHEQRSLQMIQLPAIKSLPVLGSSQLRPRCCGTERQAILANHNQMSDPQEIDYFQMLNFGANCYIAIVVGTLGPPSNAERFEKQGGSRLLGWSLYTLYHL